MLLSLGLGIGIWLLTALITWSWIRFAKARQIQDGPERRRLHDAFTPRAGGISIALVMLASCLVIFFSVAHRSTLWLLPIAAIFLFSILGFWDDLKPIRAGRKLMLHLLAVTLLWLMCKFLLSMDSLMAVVVAIAYLTTVNIWNFMDGSNGMVGMQSLLMAIGFISLGSYTAATYYYALVLAVACLGFLPFNFPVARIFLGDVGSHVLGAAVVGLAILAYSENQLTVLEIACLLSALWIDAVLTFIRRAFRGFKVTRPHLSHLYQYAIRSGKTHGAICGYYAGWTIVVILVVGLSRDLSELGQRIVLMGLIVMGAATHQGFRLFVLKSARNPNIHKSEA